MIEGGRLPGIGAGVSIARPLIDVPRPLAPLAGMNSPLPSPGSELARISTDIVPRGSGVLDQLSPRDMVLDIDRPFIDFTPGPPGSADKITGSGFWNDTSDTPSKVQVKGTLLPNFLRKLPPKQQDNEIDNEIVFTRNMRPVLREQSSDMFPVFDPVDEEFESLDRPSEPLFVDCEIIKPEQHILMAGTDVPSLSDGSTLHGPLAIDPVPKYVPPTIIDMPPLVDAPFRLPPIK